MAPYSTDRYGIDTNEFRLGGKSLEEILGNYLGPELANLMVLHQQRSPEWKEEEIGKQFYDMYGEYGEAAVKILTRVNTNLGDMVEMVTGTSLKNEEAEAENLQEAHNFGNHLGRTH